MLRVLLAAGLLALAASAQVLYSVDGSGTETPVGSSYNAGSVAAGASKSTRFRARNPGNSAIPVTKLALSGTNFSITSPLSLPPNIAPGNFLDIDVNFQGGVPAQYSASLQINTISVLMLITSVPAASLTVLSGCTGPDPATGTIDFGKVQVGQSGTCTFSLLNGNTQALTVAASVTGLGFKMPAQSYVLPPSGSVSFNVVFTPGTGALFLGTLMLDARSFPLTGTGLNPLLPTPMLLFDNPAPQSGQQITLTMRLPAASPIAASGSVSLSFQPDVGQNIGDTAVVFVATGARSVPYTIKPGDTQAQLGGQAGAVFQTGTTSGRMTFTVSGNVPIASDPTTFLVLPPVPMAVENATATRQAGSLDVQVWGFDNTYSAGSMSFTFYDLAGNRVGPVPANFTSDFHAYFGSAPGTGSTFQMRVTFPVTGDSGQISAVDVQLANSVGTTSITQLQFH
ncbi:MAG TPA: hypothetical protein VGN17_01630 [Bryobacteraceae bacterium]|jgi:hypothetical protein